MHTSKKIYKILNERPEIFHSLPATILPERQKDELKKIPRVAIGEITDIESLLAIYSILKKMKVDALVPTIAYTGTEIGGLELLYNKVNNFAKILERDLNIYVTELMILGSPGFWRALNGRFIETLQNKFKFYIPCCGCKLYLYALRIPLCKTLNASLVVSGRLKDSNKQPRFIDSDSIITYCKKLLSSFGINLYHEIIEKKFYQDDVTLKWLNYSEDISTCNICILADNYKNIAGEFKIPGRLNQFFEDYAIPVSAKIISRALSGKPIDFILESRNTLLPNINSKSSKEDTVL